MLRKYIGLFLLLSCCIVSTNAQMDGVEEEEEAMEVKPIMCYEEFGGVMHGFRHCRKNLPLQVHIHYNLTDNDPHPETNASLVMLVKVKHEGWVSFGFGMDGSMLGSNTVIGWQSSMSHENTKIGDFHLYDYHEANVIEENLQELVFANVEYVDGHTLIFFKRRLENTLAESLHVDDFAYIVYAFGALPTDENAYPLYHGRNQRATYKYQFRSGDLRIVFDPEVAAHAVCMIIAFGILIPLGISVSKWRKGTGPRALQSQWIKKNWHQIHIGFNVTGTAISMVAFFFGLFWFGTHYYKAHMTIGIITMILTILQPLNGWARPSKNSPKTTFWGQPTRFVWEFYHKNGGKLLVCLAFVNMIIGVTITEWTNLLIFILIIPFGIGMLYFTMTIKFADPDAVEPIILDEKKDKDERTPLGTGIGYLGSPSPIYDIRRPTV